jgi:hypothetical protein
MEIKYGNKFVLDFPCKDKDGSTITNLSDAEEIYFQIKQTADAEDKFISLTKTNSEITINTPDTGTVRVTGTAEKWCDRDEIPFAYNSEKGRNEFLAYWGLQLNFPDDDIREIVITDYGTETDRVTIVEDIVQG